MTIRELINESELEVIIEALNRYRVFCKTQAERPITGYGKASEYTKKDNWKNKETEIDDLMTKISNEFI